MPVSHGNTRDSKLDTTPAMQARLTAGEGQGPRVTGRNLARLSQRGVEGQVRRLSPRLHEQELLKVGAKSPTRALGLSERKL